MNMLAPRDSGGDRREREEDDDDSSELILHALRSTEYINERSKERE